MRIRKTPCDQGHSGNQRTAVAETMPTPVRDLFETTRRLHHEATGYDTCEVCFAAEIAAVLRPATKA